MIDTQRKNDLKNQLERLNNLDLIRVICAILLIFHHYQGLSGAVFTSINFYANGRWGYGYITEMFFSISGFLTAFKDDGKENNFRKYYKHKFWRIFPLTLISNIIYLLAVCLYYILNHGYIFNEKYSIGAIFSR